MPGRKKFSFSFSFSFFIITFAVENNIILNNMNTATTNASPNTFMLTMPKADVSFFKTMAKKMGWTIERKRTAKPRLYDPETGCYFKDSVMKSIEQAHEDMKHGRLKAYESVDEMFKELGVNV